MCVYSAAFIQGNEWVIFVEFTLCKIWGTKYVTGL